MKDSKTRSHPMHLARCRSHELRRPIAIACIQEAAPTPAWRARQSGPHCRTDHMINPRTQHFMAIVSGDCPGAFRGSWPVITAPAVVRDMILEAVRTTLQQQPIEIASKTHL